MTPLVTFLFRSTCFTLPAVVSLSCAARSDPNAGGAARPGISWELRAGERRGDERLVCRSGGAEPCVVEATTDKLRMLAIVGLRLHPVNRAPTNYVGTLQAPFVEGTTKLEEVSVAVAADGRPVSRTILGRVTRQPGAYTMTFSIDAFVRGSAGPVHLQEEIPVTVR